MEEDIHPVVDKILTTHFLDFLVKLVLREGPAGKSWKSVINTIDVLLWTVQPNKQQGDLERFDKVNPRLLSNLKKILGIAEVSTEEIETLMAALEKVQKESYSEEHADVSSSTEPADSAERLQADTEKESAAKAAEEFEGLLEDDPHLQEVDSFPIGIWLAFVGEQDQSIRCTLAAKIETIDKFIFVNQKGVKVVEKTRMGLARELKAGTVAIISESPLFERAMETVIGKLRDTNTAAS